MWPLKRNIKERRYSSIPRICPLPAKFLACNGCTMPPGRVTAEESWGTCEGGVLSMTVQLTNPVCDRYLLCQQESKLPYPRYILWYIVRISRPEIILLWPLMRNVTKVELLVYTRCLNVSGEQCLYHATGENRIVPTNV